MSTPAASESRICETEQVCSLCGESKPLSEFSPGRRACKPCRRERARILRLERRGERTGPRKLSAAIGQRFGHGVVIETEIRVWARRARGARLQCDCGNTYVASLASLANGEFTSCGCMFRGQMRGIGRHPLYRTWNGIIWRCENPGHPAYLRYGGRGITVCERWHDVLAFISDIEQDLGPRPTGMTLDRINNDRGYERGNVRWATQCEQAMNRQGSAAIAARRIEVAERLERGESRSQIALALGVSYWVIRGDDDWLKKRVAA